MKKIDQQPAALVSLEEEDAEAIVERSERYHLRIKTFHRTCDSLTLTAPVVRYERTDLWLLSTGVESGIHVHR